MSWTERDFWTRFLLKLALSIACGRSTVQTLSHQNSEKPRHTKYKTIDLKKPIPGLSQPKFLRNTFTQQTSPQELPAVLCTGFGRARRH